SRSFSTRSPLSLPRPSTPWRSPMTTTVLTHFSLSAQPFFKELPDADLWLPPSKAQLVELLAAALSERQQVLLFGEPGAGKTCVLRALKGRLPQDQFR